jgi:hypothetical protein
MFGGLGAKIQGMDEAVRQSMAERAMAARAKQIASVRDDLAARMGGGSPDLSSVSAAIADRLGGGADDYMAALKSKARGADVKRQALYGQAAAAENPNLAVRLNDLLSGTDAMSRAGQVATYGAIGGGAVAGLTAAGQGLMALMDYLQQGQQTADERNNELA